MSFIIDRDLLVIDSAVFVQGVDVGTKLAKGGDGVVSGTTFTSAAIDFEAQGVDEGHVIVVTDEPLEIIARPGSTSLTVSRPRMETEDPTIPPTSGSSLKFSVTTFERQIAQAHAWALGVLGLDPHDPVQPLDEAAVVNVDDFARIIALRTICDVFASAAAADTLDASLAQQANVYRDRLRRAMNSTAILLDLNGDGIADTARRMTTMVLTRS